MKDEPKTHTQGRNRRKGFLEVSENVERDSAFRTLTEIKLRAKSVLSGESPQAGPSADIPRESPLIPEELRHSKWWKQAVRILQEENELGASDTQEFL
jgi:hypothetical protein